MRASPTACAALALGLWCLGGASASLAQSLLPIDEVRLGVLAHSVDPSNAETGADINIEVLLRKSSYAYADGFLDSVLRPRFHLGASINTAGDTSQLYAGFTWDAKLASRLTLELSFGGALHDGPTGDGHEDSYGCALNFRESAALGYALDERWALYGIIAHMSNGGLCDHNSGITSVGMRLGYKLN